MMESLVETTWLAAHLGQPGLRIVDGRWRGDNSGRLLYRETHIPGAVHLDWHLDLNDVDEQGVPDRILPPEGFAAVMQAAGIGDETWVIAYADTEYSGAARLWWALRYYGHDNVSVLNGGISKWLAEGRPVEAGETPPFPTAGPFTPRPQAHWLATAAEIEAAVAAGPASTLIALVDTRPPEQYAGRAVWTPNGSLYLPPGQDWVEVDGRWLRGGHIPGAVSLPSPDNLNPADWTYLSPAALRERFVAAGVRLEQRVITYCGVGISGSLGLFALHLAGYSNLALYDASWVEWGADPQRPIALS
ncbi:MAG: sulfurtransferase [Chloroflexota bacterium]